MSVIVRLTGAALRRTAPRNLPNDQFPDHDRIVSAM
jgi:hypothetical protein